MWIWEREREQDNSSTLLVDCRLAQPFWKTIWHFLLTLKKLMIKDRNSTPTPAITRRCIKRMFVEHYLQYGIMIKWNILQQGKIDKLQLHAPMWMNFTNAVKRNLKMHSIWFLCQVKKTFKNLGKVGSIQIQ